jgi:hypothetical protein
MLWAAGLGALALLAVVYELIPVFSGPATTSLASSQGAIQGPSRPNAIRGGPIAAKKVRAENLDPTLRLELLAASEQTKYAGSGRNIFVSQAEVTIPTPVGPGATDKGKTDLAYTIPQQQPPPPIPLKFFGFANRPGEAKRVFLSQGEDVFIAGEGEIVDRRYKVVRISPTSVEIQDVVGSGPAQNIPLTQG